MTDRIVVFDGSRKDFEAMIKAEISADDVTIPFMELIQHYNARIRPSESGVKESALYNNIEVDNCIVRSDDYASVLEHALSNFVNIVRLISFAQAWSCRRLICGNRACVNAFWCR